MELSIDHWRRIFGSLENTFEAPELFCPWTV
jgi:hypothetical protein